MSEPSGAVDHEALEALAARVRDDIQRTSHPRQPWLEPRTGPEGEPALDVAIVGGGQSGLAIAFGLIRSQVGNIRVFDKAPAGREGPWLGYARMRTLRSPKDYTGPDLDMPSLTYQSWHEAAFGPESWAALDLIPRELWAAYLAWFRDTVGVPVTSSHEVTRIGPAGPGLLRLDMRDASGASSTILARKVVLATGQEGAGRWDVAPELLSLPAHLRAHTADHIDFAGLAGQVVAVIGAGASAFDNAATALEAGAAEVHLLCRRGAVQVVQPYRWITFTGFLRHLSDMDDEWRWRFMRQVMAMREGFPQQTWDRVARHSNFHLHEGAPVLAARPDGDGAVLETPAGPIRADFVISATGVRTDFGARPELADFARNIATWGDRYGPPEGERDERLAAFPYLGDDFSFQERKAGLTPWIADIHLFAIAATMSHGPSGSSINAMTTAVPKLVRGLTRELFRADLDRHWAAFRAYDVPQAVLTRRSAPPPMAVQAAPAGTGFASRPDVGEQ